MHSKMLLIRVLRLNCDRSGGMPTYGKKENTNMFKRGQYVAPRALDGVRTNVVTFEQNLGRTFAGDK